MYVDVQRGEEEGDVVASNSLNVALCAGKPTAIFVGFEDQNG